MITRIKQFIMDVKVEMSKVSWPTYDELRASTIMVILFSLAFAVLIFGMDTILGKVMGVFLG